MAQQGVKFIRKNGRVIPIREGSGGGAKPARGQLLTTGEKRFATVAGIASTGGLVAGLAPLPFSDKFRVASLATSLAGTFSGTIGQLKAMNRGGNDFHKRQKIGLSYGNHMLAGQGIGLAAGIGGLFGIKYGAYGLSRVAKSGAVRHWAAGRNGTRPVKDVSPHTLLRLGKGGTSV